jgi:hypothetical protein
LARQLIRGGLPSEAVTQIIAVSDIFTFIQPLQYALYLFCPAHFILITTVLLSSSQFREIGSADPKFTIIVAIGLQNP